METNKLHPIVKNKWVKALRSGKYKQARGVLRKPVTGGMCCIGVLCDIYGMDHELTNNYNDLPSNTFFEKNGFPNSICKLKNKIWLNLTEMNDNERKRFKTIANYIEKEL